MFFGTQEQALERLDEATDLLSKLMDNNMEDANTLTKVSKNLLLGLGNILNISSQDASVVSMQTTWYKIDKEKVLKYIREFDLGICFDLIHLPSSRIIVILSVFDTLQRTGRVYSLPNRFILTFPVLNAHYIAMNSTASHCIVRHSTALHYTQYTALFCSTLNHTNYSLHRSFLFSLFFCHCTAVNCCHLCCTNSSLVHMRQIHFTKTQHASPK